MTRRVLKTMVPSAALIGLLVLMLPIGRRAAVAGLQRLRGVATVDQRVAEYAPSAEPRLRARFQAAGVVYPPRSVVLLALKSERELRVFATDGGPTRRIASFPILGASGEPGPKLREGDRQVPEGEYRAESLNPNSLYLLAIRVGYPNEEDQRIGAAEGRTNLGGDIMIHGKTCSIGCLAMGDPAMEELFILAARVGVEHVKVVISPSLEPKSNLKSDSPDWLRARYESLQVKVDQLSAN